MDFFTSLRNCKRRVRKLFNGYYLDKNEYLEDFPKDPSRLSVDVSKLEPWMKSKFDDKCKGCMNESLDGCKYNSQDCWDSVFNLLPNGIMAFLLATQYKSAIVKNEIGTEDLERLVNEYKDRTADLKTNVKKILNEINNPKN